MTSKFPQKLLSIKSTMQLCGSIVMAGMGFYTGIIGGGILGAIMFAILFFFWGLVTIPLSIDDFQENPVKNSIYIFIFIIVIVILNNYR